MKTKEACSMQDRTSTLASRGLLGLVDHVAEAHHVTRGDVLGRGRTKRVAQARHAVMRALRDMGMSYPEIGRLLGRDHTTVLAALRKAPANALRVA